MLKIIQLYHSFGSTERVLHFKTFHAKWNVIGAKICFNTPRCEVCNVHCNPAFVGNVCDGISVQKNRGWQWIRSQPVDVKKYCNSLPFLKRQKNGDEICQDLDIA
jgi:hypothetical protein